MDDTKPPEISFKLEYEEVKFDIHSLFGRTFQKKLTVKQLRRKQHANYVLG